MKNKPPSHRQKSRAMRAVAIGAADKLTRMLAGGLDADTLSARRYTLLEEAWSRDRPLMLSRLLQAGARPSWWVLDEAWVREHESPVHAAACRHLERALASNPPRATLKMSNWTRRPDALLRLRRLLDAGMPADVRERGPGLGSGNRLLIRALWASAPDLVALLLARGASPDKAPADSLWPLVEAASRHDAASIRALLAAGANPAAIHAESALPVVSLALLAAVPLPSRAFDEYGSRFSDWDPPGAPATAEDWALFMATQDLLLTAGASWDASFSTEWLQDALDSLDAVHHLPSKTMSVRQVRALVPEETQARWSAEETAHALDAGLPEGTATARFRF